MILYRICKEKHSNDLAKGAEMVGGRWNSKGVAVIYVSENIALCTAEVAVHVPLGIMPEDYVLVTISMPEDSMLVINEQDLPDDWWVFPHPASTQEIGNRFVSEGKYAVMRVPSAVVPGEFNYIINPAHPRAKTLKVERIRPYRFDKRLFKAGK
jgi:RES domain-containing protein